MSTSPEVISPELMETHEDCTTPIRIFLLDPSPRDTQLNGLEIMCDMRIITDTQFAIKATKLYGTKQITYISNNCKITLSDDGTVIRDWNYMKKQHAFM